MLTVIALFLFSFLALCRHFLASSLGENAYRKSKAQVLKKTFQLLDEDGAKRQLFILGDKFRRLYEGITYDGIIRASGLKYKKQEDGTFQFVAYPDSPFEMSLVTDEEGSQPAEDDLSGVESLVF